MGLFSGFCCCFSRSAQTPTPDMIEQWPARPVPSQNQSHVPNEMFVYTGNNNVRDDEGYAPTIPLPRYTPRPMSIREKTIEENMHMRSSSSGMAAESTANASSDEKQRHLYEYDRPDSRNEGVTADDVSSAFSFQSSYGNTSTATRETPPPPYSAGVSPAPSMRSTTVSVSSGINYGHGQQPMVNIAQPQPMFQRPEWMIRSSRCSVEVEEEMEVRRFSWESR